jgi:hypothetical protein
MAKVTPILQTSSILVWTICSLWGCNDECDDYAEAVCARACDCGEGIVECRANNGDGVPSYGAGPVEKCESDFDYSCEHNATIDIDACLTALDGAACLAGALGGVQLPVSCQDPDGHYP